MGEFTHVVNGTLTIERGEFRKLVHEFDLIVLGDVPGKFFTGEQQLVIKDNARHSDRTASCCGTESNAPAGENRQAR